MKRRVVLLLLPLLMAGAIVNIAVAWRATWFRSGSRTVHSWQARSSELAELARVGLSPLPESTYERFVLQTDTYESFDHTSAVIYDVRELKPDGATSVRRRAAPAVANVVRCGWPLRAVSCLVWRKRPSQTWGDVEGRWRVAGGMFINYENGQRAVPLRPLWPGFAINTVLYAAILAPLFFLPFALRRRRRIKRGLCVKCGYNLRGSPPTSDACPECGTRHSEL